MQWVFLVIREIEVNVVRLTGVFPDSFVVQFGIFSLFEGEYMKRQCLILVATFILAGSGVSWSAEISGNVTRQDSGTPIIYASINLSEENNNFLRYLGPVNPDGSYHFSDIEQGN